MNLTLRKLFNTTKKKMKFVALFQKNKLKKLYIDSHRSSWNNEFDFKVVFEVKDTFFFSQLFHALSGMIKVSPKIIWMRT